MKTNIYFPLFLSGMICLSACQRKGEVLSETSNITKEYIMGAISTDNVVLTEDFIIHQGNQEEYIRMALEANSLDVLALLLKNSFEKSNIGESPYFYVRSKEAFLLLEKYGYSPNVVNYEGQSLAEFYFQKKGKEFLKFILRESENIDLSSEKNLLFQKEVLEDVELLHWLNKRKADFTSYDVLRNYPIYYAEKEETLNFLLDFPYDVNHQNVRRENVLGEVYLRLQQKGNKKLLQKCLQKGVNTNYRSYQ